MENFFDSELCKSGDACNFCRHSKAYRKGILASFKEPKDVDFDCPVGKGNANDGQVDIFASNKEDDKRQKEIDEKINDGRNKRQERRDERLEEIRKRRVSINCDHWEDCGIEGGGCCKINKFKNPSFGTCVIACDIGKKSGVKMPVDQKEEQPEPPPMKDKMVNFSEAMFGVAKTLLKKGQIVVPDDVLVDRINICESNKCGKFNGKKMLCASCGCPFKKKLVLATEKCPLDMWDRYEVK